MKVKMETIKVGISGSRSITDAPFIYKTLDYYLSQLLLKYKVVLVHGNAKGVDYIANDWAISKGLEVIIFEPEYDLYHAKRAPLERNTEIVNESDYLIAIQHNSSSGTQDSINKALKKGIPTKIIQYEK